MIRIKNLVGHDRISIGLLAVALVSFLAALTVTTTTSFSAIPERLLDRVRGASPSWFRTVNPTLPNCTALMVFQLTSAGFTVVAWTGCNAANIGTTCIQCANVPNYQLNATPGTPLAYPKPVESSECNGGSGSSSGTCQLIGGNPACNLMNGYDCDQYAFYYTLE